MNDPAQPMEGWVYLGRSYMFLGKYGMLKVVSTGLIPGQRTRSARSSIRKNGFVPRVPHRVIPSTQDGQRDRAEGSFTFCSLLSNRLYECCRWILPVPEKFQTTADKDKQAAPVMYLSRRTDDLLRQLWEGKWGKGPLSHS